MGLGDHLKEKEAGPVVLSGLCCGCRKQGCEGLRGGCGPLAPGGEGGRLEDTGVGVGAGGSGGTGGTQALAPSDPGPRGGLELAGMCPDIEGVEDRLQGPGQSREAQRYPKPEPKCESMVPWTGLLAWGQWEMAEF